MLGPEFGSRLGHEILELQHSTQVDRGEHAVTLSAATVVMAVSTARYRNMAARMTASEEEHRRETSHTQEIPNRSKRAS